MERREDGTFKPETMEEAVEFFTRELDEFKPGDKVRQVWRDSDGDTRYRWPEPGKTAVVIGTTFTPRPLGTGEPFVNETLVLVKETSRGDFLRYTVDPVYFEKAE